MEEKISRCCKEWPNTHSFYKLAKNRAGVSNSNSFITSPLLDPITKEKTWDLAKCCNILAKAFDIPIPTKQENEKKAARHKKRKLLQEPRERV